MSRSNALSLRKVILASGLLLTTPALAQVDHPLSRDEVRSVFVGKSSHWVRFIPFGGNDTDVYLSPGGDFLATTPEGQVVRTTYTIDKRGFFCNAGGACAPIIEVEQGTYVLSSGGRKLATIVAVRPGDALQLSQRSNESATRSRSRQKF